MERKIKGGREEELVVWLGSELVGCSAAAVAGTVCLSPPQSEGNHLLGMGADCLSGRIGAWTWELRMCMGSEYVYGIYFFVSMLGVRARGRECMLVSLCVSSSNLVQECVHDNISIKVFDGVNVLYKVRR